MRNKSVYLIIIVISLILHVLPYLINHIPLGYDSGIYIYAMKRFPVIPHWISDTYWSFLFALTYFFIQIGIPADTIVIPLSFISQVLLFSNLYYLTKKILGKKAALWAVLLLTTSAIQYRAYWFFYLKNSFALAFLLFTLYFSTKRKLLPTIIFGFLVGSFHLPTFMVLVFILITDLMIQLIKKILSSNAVRSLKNNHYSSRSTRTKNSITHQLTIKLVNQLTIFPLVSLFLILFFTFLFYLPHAKEIIMPYIKPLTASSVAGITNSTDKTSGGTFYPVGVSFLLTLLYLPFSFYGGYKTVKQKKYNSPFFIAFVLTALLVITRFFFYQRLFIILDIFLIIYAAKGIIEFSERYRNNSSVKEFLRLYPFLLIVFITAFVLKTGQPLISKDVFNEIKTFGKTNTKGYILSTAKEDSAWLIGYTDLPVIADSYGGNDNYWSDMDWDRFYLTEKEPERTELINKLPKPLFIFMNEKTKTEQMHLMESVCLKKESPRFYRYECR